MAGRGRRSRPAGPGRRVAAAERGRHARGRPPDHRQGEERGRAGRERAVGVEQRRREQARPGGDLGHRRLGGGALDRSRAAAVDEPQRRDGAHGRHHGGAAGGQLARRGALHRPQGGAQHRVAGRAVADAGDLRLVHQQPVQLQPGPGGDRARQVRGLLGRAQRRALGADPHPAAERPPAGVDVDAHAHRPAPGRDQVELLAAVDHHGDPVTRGAVRQLPQRRAIHGRVRDHHVVGAGRGQPQRLRQREREDPLESRAQRAVGERPAADRFRRQPHRRSAGAAQQIGGVGVERVEVDDRERRIEVRGGGVQGVQQGVHAIRRALR